MGGLKQDTQLLLVSFCEHGCGKSILRESQSPLQWCQIPQTTKRNIGSSTFRPLPGPSIDTVFFLVRFFLCSNTQLFHPVLFVSGGSFVFLGGWTSDMGPPRTEGQTSCKEGPKAVPMVSLFGHRQRRGGAQQKMSFVLVLRIDVRGHVWGL